MLKRFLRPLFFCGFTVLNLQAAEIPQRAFLYLPILKQTQDSVWKPSDIGFIAREIHAETCITLAHPFCWSPKAQLKTSREEGAGLGQITRAFNKDGSTRFDVLGDAKKTPELKSIFKDVSWESIYDNPRAQIFYLVWRQSKCYARFSNFEFCLSAYNAGEVALIKSIGLCRLDPKCDSSRWFDNVALHCGRLTAKIYNQTACSINRGYVFKIQVKLRSFPYHSFL